MTPPRCVCLTVHAERLHDDAVWRAVRGFLTLVERRGGAATFLVSPLRASAAGVDLAPRLRDLVERGHEVGQHTHYYALGAPTTGRVQFAKRTDASPDNVRRCLDHDHARLAAAGVRPRGFVAGAWEPHDAARRWLVEHGFRYDLTRRTFPLRYPGRPVAPGRPGPPSLLAGGLLDVSTNGTLARALRHHVGRHADPHPYGVWYVHDYDLVRLRHRAGFRALDHALADVPRITVRQLAELLTAGPAARTSATARADC